MRDSPAANHDQLVALAAALAAAALEARQTGQQALARELDHQHARVRAEVRTAWSMEQPIRGRGGS